MGVRITNAGDRPVLWIYGTIGDEYGGITADEVRNAMGEIPKKSPFDVRIFSDGGSFDEAMAIYSLLSQRGDKSCGMVDGLAASAASLLLQATGTRQMAQHSRQMIHQVHGSVRGSLTADEFRAIADQMDSTNRELMSIYSKKWKGSESELASALSQDTWMNAKESVACGLADCVVDGPSIAARVNTKLFNYANVPSDVQLVEGPITPPWVYEMQKKLESVLA